MKKHLASRQTGQLTESAQKGVDQFLNVIGKYAKTIALNGPAKERELKAYEQELGVSLPSTLAHLWVLHDGQKLSDSDHCLFDYFPFYSIKRSRKERQDVRALAKGIGTESEADDYLAWAESARTKVITVCGPVKARNYNKLWIPIGSYGSVFRFVDMDPAPGGRVGQVIEHSLESLTWRVLAPSFARFLKLIANAFEKSKGNWADHELFPDQDCELPKYLSRALATARKLVPQKVEECSGSLLIKAQIRLIIGYASGEMVLKLAIAKPKRELWALVQKQTKGRARIVMGAKGRFTVTSEAKIPNGGTAPVPYLVKSFDWA